MMTLVKQISRISFIGQFLEHLRIPLYRNGYALVFSSVATSGLGLVFWVVAARQYTADVVGINSAILSVVTLLVNVAQFNLQNMLNRFIPVAGRATFRLVGYSYLITTAITTMVALAFVGTLQIWSPSLSFIQSSPVLIVSVVLFAVIWCLFTLQDSVLTGLRQAMIVPVENIAFGVMKLLFIIGLAVVLPGYGILASWVVAAMLTLLPVNLLIFRRLIPLHSQTAVAQAVPLAPRKLISFVLADHVGSIAWSATISLLPLIVIERLGAAANGYFYVAWTVSYSIYLIGRNMGMSLVTEASSNPAKLYAYAFQMLVQTARLVLPITAIFVIGAPLILRLFGNEYATEASALFRLLSLSVIPNIIISFYISIARVRRRMRALLLVQILLSVLVLGLTFPFLDWFGINGIALALLVSQSLFAGVLLLTELRPAWLPFVDLELPIRLLSGGRRLWWRWSSRHQINRAYSLIPRLTVTLPGALDAQPTGRWAAEALIHTVSDVIVIKLKPSGAFPAAHLKITHTDAGKESLLRQESALKSLHSNEALGEWRSLLPVILSKGEIGHDLYLIEKSVPGLDARSVLLSPQRCESMRRAAASAIGELHRQTAVLTTVNDDALSRWVDEHVQILRKVYAAYSPSSEKQRTLDHLTVRLHEALRDQAICVSWVHGDFAPRNILVTPDGATVTGIVDWDFSHPGGLPQLDLLLLFFSIRMRTRKEELGYIVRELLEQSQWTTDEQKVFEATQSNLPGNSIDMATLVLLSWLHHVSSVLGKTARYSRHSWWLGQNVESVLNSL